MRSTTYQHTLTWNWDKITIQDKNSADVKYQWVEMYFDSDITIRGAEWEDELLITADMSPMTASWFDKWWFPFEIKGTSGVILSFITLN